MTIFMPQFKPFLPFLAVFTLLTACSDKPTLDKKTRLLNTLQDMELAIEAKNIDDFMTHVSDDFKNTARGWNKKDTERLLRLRLMRNKSVHIHQAIKRIDWLNEGAQQAEVEVVVAMAGTDFSLEDLPSLRGDLVKFVVTFKQRDDSYQVIKTEWDRANPTDFVF